MSTEQTSDEIATTIETAAELIRTNGLCKGQYWPGAINDDYSYGISYQFGMPMCALGALSVAGGSSLAHDADEFSSVKEVVQDVIGGCVHDWNDMPDTTADEVIERFLEIAKDLRNGEIVP